MTTDVAKNRDSLVRNPLEVIWRNPGIGAAELAQKCGMTRDNVVSAMAAYVHCGRISIKKVKGSGTVPNNTYYPCPGLNEYLDKLHHRIMSGKRSGKVRGELFWTAEKIAKFKLKYPDMDTQAISDEFGISTSAAWKMASRLGLRKSEEYMSVVSDSALPLRDYPSELIELMILNKKLQGKLNGKY